MLLLVFYNVYCMKDDNRLYIITFQFSQISIVLGINLQDVTITWGVSSSDYNGTKRFQ